MKIQIDSVTFLKELHERSGWYFKNQPNGRYGNRNLYIKAIILFMLLCTCWWLLYVVTPNIIIAIFIAILFGATKAGIGFNVMHDALHGSFSKKRWLNKVLGYSLDLLGGDSKIWKWQHNQNHHVHTNVMGQDHDIDVGKLGRFSPEQPWHWWHKYQYVYVWFLYGISYLAWIFWLDYGKAKKMGWNKENYNKTFLLFLKKLFINNAIFLFVPLYLCKPFYDYVLLTYLVTEITCGLITSCIFQLAHVVEDTAMLPQSDQVVRYDAIWQLQSTADFGTQNKVLFWYLGGLNFQVEHHLGFTVSHIHYPAVHTILQSLCAKYDLRLLEYKNLHQATLSHIRQLKKLGRKPELL